MDDRKRARDDDLPIIGDYSDAQNARLRSATDAAGASSERPATPPVAARTAPTAARSAAGSPARPGGADAWRIDPSDVARHARLRRQRERSGPLRRALRYFVVVVALAGAFAVYWNFDTLRRVTIDVPDLSALLRGSSSGDAGARAPGGAQSTAVEPSLVVGTAAPTSVGGAARDRDRTVAAAEGATRAAPIAEPPLPPVAPGSPAAEDPPAAQDSPAAASSPGAQSTPAADSAPGAESVPATPAVVEQRPAPPTPETFGFAVPQVTVSESDASATVLILRDGGNRGVSSVTWWTSDGTAKAGSDYVDLGKVVVKFAAGEQNRAIHIPIIGDQAAEGQESFYVNLAAGDDPSAEPQDRVEVVIEDDD